MNNIIESNKNKFTTQIVHGDLAHYNVISETKENGRPTVVGVIDFGDVVNSWIVGDLASAIVPLLCRNDYNALSIACNVIQGYVNIAPLNEFELLSLWPLIIQRSILLYVSIYFQYQLDQSDYCREELILNKYVLDKVLNIPLYTALIGIYQAAGLECPNRNLITNYSHSLIDIDSKYSLLDLSTTSDKYSEGNWFNKNDVSKIIENNHSNGVTVIKYGIPLLYRGASPRCLQAKNSIPLGTVVYLASGTIITTPADGLFSIISFNLDHNDNYIISDTTTASSLLCVLLEYSNHSVIIEGLDIINENKIVKAGQVIGKVKINSNISSDFNDLLITQGSYIRIQNIPKGFITNNNKVSMNTYESYTSEFLPPRYCNENDWLILKNICIEPFINNTLKDLYLSNLNDEISYIADGELNKRYEYYAKNQEHYFKKPPSIERGFMQYLYDKYGRTYIDMVNNVTVLGHCHPKPVKAAIRQLNLLNTNSRFIYNSLGNFTEKIISTIPQEIRDADKLNTVFLVNSGSEATDLALRIARVVVTERRRKLNNNNSLPLNRDVICIEGKY